MTSSVQPLQQQHQAKFRWTENLTCRFIQLRKEHGKMFTGRKYSAQAGWEYILRQMREEFPTIMADVHYRVLKKKWSNLLQQYKELKNPVHGDKNKADDISWPFYNAIDEVLCNLGLPRGRRLAANSPDCYDEMDDEDQDDDLNPQEFLCVSVAPDSDDEDNNMHISNNYEDELDEHQRQQQQQQQHRDDEAVGRAVPELQPLGRGPVFDVDRLSRAARHSPTSSSRKHMHAESSSEELLSRLPRATELTIRPIRRSEGLPGPSEQQLPPPSLEPINGRGELEIFRDSKRLRGKQEEHEDERARKSAKHEAREEESSASRLERSVVEFMEYTRKRDEENRSILMRMLEAIEDIRNATRR